MDEFHLLLKEKQTADFSVEIWKRFRKWGGIPTGLTQNSKDFLENPQLMNILDNSEFIYLLNQSEDDGKILKDKLHLSDEPIELRYKCRYRFRSFDLWWYSSTVQGSVPEGFFDVSGSDDEVQ